MFIPIEKTGFVYTLDGRTIGYQDPAAIAGVRTPFKGSMCSTFSRVYIETPVTRWFMAAIPNLDSLYEMSILWATLVIPIQGCWSARILFLLEE